MFGTLLATLGGMVIGSIATYVFLNSEQDKENEKKAQSKSTGTSQANTSKSETTEIDRKVLTVSQIEREGLLTGILAQLWDHINVAGSQIIRESVEPSLAASLPKPFNTIRFTKIDLGMIPIRLDNIVVHERENGVVQFDVDVVWDGDCEIQLKADYVGSLGVKTIKFHGRMAFVLKPLTDVLPIASAIQYFFIDPPALKLDFTGLAQVADMKMISGKIRQVIDDSLAGMVVLPNRMMTKMDPAVSYYDVYQPPRGVVRVSLLSGKGFVTEKRRVRSNDVPDVYCKVKLGTSPPWKSTTVQNSLEPVWPHGESGDFLLSDYGQTLVVQVFDEDKGSIDADDHLGTAMVTVQQLLLAAGNRSMALKIKDEDGKDTGAQVTLRCDLLPLTTKSLTSFTMQKASSNAMGGLLTVLVSHATNVSTESSKVGTYVKVTYGDKHNFSTPAILEAPGVDAINPAYDSTFQIPITTKEFLAERPDILLQVLQTTENVEKPKLLGQRSILHSELSRAPETTLQEKCDVGNGVSLDFRISLQGLRLEGVPVVGTPEPPVLDPITQPEETKDTTGSSNLETPAVVVEPPLSVPSGTIRLTAVKGRGFQIEKRRMKKSDIPDVFLKIQVGSSNKPWSTAVVQNSTEPEWNESAAFLISDNADIITVEAFDRDSGRRDSDDFLGAAKVTIGKIVLLGGTMELELEEDGKSSGAFITLRCEKSG